MFSLLRSRKTRSVPPSTVLEITCNETKIEKKCGFYNGTTLEQIFDTVKAIYDLPETHRVSLMLEDGTKLTIKPEMSSVVKVNLRKRAPKRMMVLKEGEWKTFEPQRKKRKLEKENAAAEQKKEIEEAKTIVEPEPDMPKKTELTIKKLSNEDGPEGFYGSAAAIDGEGKIFVYGGINEENEVVGSTANWDPELEMWDTGMDEDPRCFHTTTWIPSKGQFFIFGGYNKEDDEIEFLQNPVFSDSGVLFSAELHGKVPTARYGHTINAIANDSIFLFGGIDENSPNNDCLRLSSEGWHWDVPEMSGDVPSGRGFHTATKMGNQLIIIGGANNEKCFGDIYVLNLENWTWTKPEISGNFGARCRHCAVPIGETKIVIFGGQDNIKEDDASQVSDHFVLDISSTPWKTTSLDSLYGLNSISCSGHVALPVKLKHGNVWIFGGKAGTKGLESLRVLDAE